MKSGTNWVARLLNLHPSISCIGEMHFQSIYETAQRDMRTLPIMVDHHVRRVMRENLQAMLRQTLIDLTDSAATVIGERTPHTLNPVILKGASHITLVRDARDVLVSRFFHLFNNPQVSRIFHRFPELQSLLTKFQADEWYFHQHPDQLLTNKELVQESVRWWRQHLESDRKTIATHPGLAVLQLRYEDFHNDVNAQCRRMFRFLNVDPDIVANVPSELTPGLKIEQPGQFNRKGQVGDWKNYVTDHAKMWIKEEAGQELIRQGYVDNNDW